MKKSDKIIITATLFLLLFCLSYIVTKETVAAIIIAFLLTITIIYAFFHLMKRRMETKKIPLSKLEDGLSFMGISEQTKLFYSSLPECFEPRLTENHIELTVNCEKTAIFPNYKFLPCSKEDIARFYRICKENDIKTCIILSRQNPRELLLFARSLPLNARFLRTKEVREYLIKHNLIEKAVMPRKTEKKKKITAESIRRFFSDFISKERGRYFLIAGCSLAVACIFSPFRIYYAVFSSVNLIIALICYVKGAI